MTDDDVPGPEGARCAVLAGSVLLGSCRLQSGVAQAQGRAAFPGRPTVLVESSCPGAGSASATWGCAGTCWPRVLRAVPQGIVSLVQRSQPPDPPDDLSTEC